MFTALVIFVTGFPDLSPILIQATLLLLNFLLLLFIFLMLWVGNQGLYCMKNIPPFARGAQIFNLLYSFGVCLLGFVVVLVFVYLNLIVLALASLVMWVVFVVFGYFFITKPYIELRKKH